MSEMGFAMLGCGSAGVPVAQALAASPLARLRRAYDVDPALAEDLTRQHGGTPAESLEALLADPEVEAVYVAVPHAQLAPLAEQVLRAGKHALVEKPMALSLDAVDRLAALARERQLGLGVYYQLRFTRAFAQARQIVQAGVLGRVLAVRVQALIDKAASYWQSGLSHRSHNPWRASKAQAGGGVVLMNVSHLLDALWSITGLEVVRVAAEADALVAPVEVEDTAAATFRYHTGALGSLMTGAHLAGPGDQGFDLFGTDGQLHLGNPYQDEAPRVFLKQGWPAMGIPANTWHSLPGEPVPIYQAALEAFIQAARDGRPAPVGADAARRVLQIILALYQSAEEKRTIEIERKVEHEDH